MKRKSRPPKPKPKKAFQILGTIVIGFILVMMWAQVLAHIHKDNWLGGTNYYGAPISTMFMLIAAIVLTPILLIRSWIELRKAFGKKKENPKSRSKAARRMKRNKPSR